MFTFFWTYVVELYAATGSDVRNLVRCFHAAFAPWRRWLLRAPGPATTAAADVLDEAETRTPLAALRALLEYRDIPGVDARQRRGVRAAARARARPPHTHARARTLAVQSGCGRGGCRRGRSR